MPYGNVRYRITSTPTPASFATSGHRRSAVTAGRPRSRARARQARSPSNRPAARVAASTTLPTWLDEKSGLGLSQTSASIRRKPVELRQTVIDRFPRCFRADKDVGAWAYCRNVDQSSQRDMHICTVAYERVQKRTASSTMRIMTFLIAMSHDVVFALCNNHAS